MSIHIIIRGKTVHEVSVHCGRAVLSSGILGHLRRRKRVTTNSRTGGKAVHQLSVHWWRTNLSSEILGHLLWRKSVNTYNNTREDGS